MARRSQLGLDELMIVNPGSPHAVRRVTVRRLGSARLSNVDVEAPTRGAAQASGRTQRAPARSRVFLGNDGALYEVIE